MAHYELTMPVSEAQARQLRINDTVTLHQTLYGIRDATQIQMFDHGRATRFNLNGHAVIHTAPNVKKSSQAPITLLATCRSVLAQLPRTAWSALPSP